MNFVTGDCEVDVLALMGIDFMVRDLIYVPYLNRHPLISIDLL